MFFCLSCMCSRTLAECCRLIRNNSLPMQAYCLIFYPHWLFCHFPKDSAGLSSLCTEKNKTTGLKARLFLPCASKGGHFIRKLPWPLQCHYAALFFLLWGCLLSGALFPGKHAIRFLRYMASFTAGMTSSITLTNCASLYGYPAFVIFTLTSFPTISGVAGKTTFR